MIRNDRSMSIEDEQKSVVGDYESVCVYDGSDSR